MEDKKFFVIATEAEPGVITVAANAAENHGAREVHSQLGCNIRWDGEHYELAGSWSGPWRKGTFQARVPSAQPTGQVREELEMHLKGRPWSDEARLAALSSVILDHLPGEVLKARIAAMGGPDRD